MMNRQVILKNRPSGVAQASDFEIVSVPQEPVREGLLLVANRFLSVDPAMRGWIADTENYSAPVPLGSVMRSLAVGEVLESKAPGFEPGDIVTGWFGWQAFALVSPEAVFRRVVEHDLPMSAALGVLGINGMTALIALRTIARPEPGEVVLVSASAGAVGSAVGQLARLNGCRTVGICGGPDKVRECVETFGYDAAIDYKREDVDRRLGELCPDGVNVYFDNVAGGISDTVYRHLARSARVVVCGTASISDWSHWPMGPRVERHLLVKRAAMQGFVIFDHADAYEEAVFELAELVRHDQLVFREDILDGLESCPDALAGLYRGENSGKRLIRL